MRRTVCVNTGVATSAVVRQSVKTQFRDVHSFNTLCAKQLLNLLNVETQSCWYNIASAKNYVESEEPLFVDSTAVLANFFSLINQHTVSSFLEALNTVPFPNVRFNGLLWRCQLHSFSEFPDSVFHLLEC